MPEPHPPAPFRAHWLRLRATAHPTEDVERVEAALCHVAEAEVVRTPMESQHGGTITVLEGTITRSQDIRTAIRRLLAAAGALDADARTDDEGVFYLRFDKQEAFGGRLVPTAGDDAVQVRLKPAVHPATREAAVAALQDLLDGRTG